MIGDWRIIIPIDNLKFEERTKIGQIDLIPFDELDDEIVSRISMIDDSTQSTPQAKEANRRILEDYIISKFKDKTCACINIYGESDLLYHEAISQVEIVINLLRIYIPILKMFREHLRIGINEGWIQPLSVICLRQDKNEYIIQNKAFRFKIDLVISKDEVTLLKDKYHLNDFNELLSKGNSVSKYENQILTAMKWIGMGIHDEINSDKLLKLTIALECLILVGNESKSEALAEMCSFLLNDNYVYIQIKNFYKKRSRIVHNGKSDIKNEEIDRFLNLVLSTLFRILDLRKEVGINNKKDLKKFADSQKSKILQQRIERCIFID